MRLVNRESVEKEREVKVELPGFGDVEEAKDFEPIPAGRYTVLVDNVTQEVGKESGEPYLAWESSVQGGEFEGRKLWWNTSLSEKSRPFLKKCFNAGNIPFEANSFNTEDCLGAIMDVEVRVEEFEKKERNKVTNQYPHEG